MKIWQALFNDMTYESCAGTISLHRTKEGAELAIKKHKHKDHIRHLEMYSPDRISEKHKKKDYDIKKSVGFTDAEIEEYDREKLEDWPKSWQWWGVQEMELQN